MTIFYNRSVSESLGQPCNKSVPNPYYSIFPSSLSQVVPNLLTTLDKQSEHNLLTACWQTFHKIGDFNCVTKNARLQISAYLLANMPNLLCISWLCPGGGVWGVSRLVPSITVCTGRYPRCLGGLFLYLRGLTLFLTTLKKSFTSSGPVVCNERFCGSKARPRLRTAHSRSAYKSEISIRCCITPVTSRIYRLVLYQTSDLTSEEISSKSELST